VLDANATFRGRFTAQQDVRVQGTLSGEVVCGGRFTIDPSGTVDAKVEARDIEINGNFEGEVECTGVFRLGSTAVVRGTIKAGAIAIEEGASLNGQVDMGEARRGSR
jgi:cytoskeletal protein CcmA (bactofilin family)